MKYHKHYFWITIVQLAVIAALLNFGQSPMRALALENACTPGPHGGAITADQTWCLADSPHLINDWLTINPGVTLTIEAGSTVQTDLMITVNGSLVAIGTPDQMITFTSNADSAPAQWRGLVFYGTEAAGDLRYVNVRFAGWSNNPASDFNHTGLISAKDLTQHALRLEHCVLTNGNDASNLDEPNFRDCSS